MAVQRSAGKKNEPLKFVMVPHAGKFDGRRLQTDSGLDHVAGGSRGLNSGSNMSNRHSGRSSPDRGSTDPYSQLNAAHVHASLDAALLGVLEPRAPLTTLPEVKEKVREEEEHGRESRQAKQRRSLFPGRARAVRSSQKALTKTNSAPGDLPNLLGGLGPAITSAHRASPTKQLEGGLYAGGVAPQDRSLHQQASAKSIRTVSMAPGLMPTHETASSVYNGVMHTDPAAGRMSPCNLDGVSSSNRHAGIAANVMNRSMDSNESDQLVRDIKLRAKAFRPLYQKPTKKQREELRSIIDCYFNEDVNMQQALNDAGGSFCGLDSPSFGLQTIDDPKRLFKKGMNSENYKTALDTIYTVNDEQNLSKHTNAKNRYENNKNSQTLAANTGRTTPRYHAQRR